MKNIKQTGDVENPKMNNRRAKSVLHIIIPALVVWVILVVISLVISPPTTLALLKGIPAVLVGLFVKLPFVLGVPALILLPICWFVIGVKSLSKFQNEIIEDNNGGLGSLIGLIYLALVLATTVVVFFS